MMSMQYSSPGDIYNTGGNYQNTGMSGGYYTGGSLPPGTNYNNYPSMTGSNGFVFRKRYERVDWKKIAAADIDQISRDLDFNTLQENIMNITFCNIEAELDVGKMDPHFVKLFKLSQLTIEYLLHSQDYLSGMVSTMEEKMKKLLEDVEDAHKQTEKHKSELNEVKKESHKRKKMLIAQQQIMNAGINSYHKCPFCAKAFVNQTFLQSHLQRRHTEHASQAFTVSQLQNQTVAPPVAQPQVSMAQSQGQVSDEQKKLMEKQLDEIKERLKLTESQLNEERNTRNSVNQKEKEEASRRERNLHMEMEEWKKEQLTTQKKETERVREMFMKELKEMNEKYNSATKSLETLQRKGRSNLGAMHDENENDRQQLLKQREEVAMLKEQLEAKMDDVHSEMQSKFSDQEQKWKDKVKELNRKHRDELAKLNSAYEENIHDIRADKKERERLETEYQRKMHEMEEAIQLTRSQDHKLKAQEKQMTELSKKVQTPVVASRPPIQKDEVQSLKKPSAPPRPMSPDLQDSEEDSDQEDETTVDGTTTLGTTGLQTGLSNMGIDTLSLGTGTLNSVAVRLLAEVKQDPNLLSAMREEIKSVLDENLSKRGIPATATGISSPVYADKMHILKLERQAQQKKHSNFFDIRQQYIRQIDDMAKEKMKKAEAQGASKLKAGARGDPKPPRPVSPNRPISPNRPPRSAPRPAPRATSPQGKLLSTMSTMSSTGTYATTTGSQSTWGTEEASSSHWDSDADSDEETERTDRKTPTPRQRVNMKHANDEEDDEEESDWDDGSELEPTPRSPVRSVPTTPQPRGAKVTQLRDKIENQLAARGKKPAGGVDSVALEDEKKKKEDSWDDDDDDDFSVSSLEETASAPPSRNNSVQRKANTPTDLSTGTSVWGGSSKDKNRPQPSPRRSGVPASTLNRGGSMSLSKNSMVSVSDFDEDSDLSVDDL